MGQKLRTCGKLLPDLRKKGGARQAFADDHPVNPGPQQVRAHRHRDESERQIADAARAVRRAFTSPTGYRFLGITRAEVRQGTARARQAAESMGAVPDEVLEGEREAPYGPQAQGGFGTMNARRTARAQLSGDGSDPISAEERPEA